MKIWNKQKKTLTTLVSYLHSLSFWLECTGSSQFMALDITLPAPKDQMMRMKKLIMNKIRKLELRKTMITNYRNNQCYSQMVHYLTSLWKKVTLIYKKQIITACKQIDHLR